MSAAQNNNSPNQPPQESTGGGALDKMRGIAGRVVRLFEAKERFEYSWKPIAVVTIIELLIGAIFVSQQARVDRIFFGLLWAGACTTIGWLTGFLFSVPRALQAETEREKLQTSGRERLQTSGVAATFEPSRYELRINTNLEQISDWLTKILVGLGLTQLDAIPSKLHDAAAYIATGFGGAQDAPFALAIILYFSVVGFMGGYILTRVYFSRVLALSEGRNLLQTG